MDSKIVLIETGNELELALKTGNEFSFFGDGCPGTIIDKNHYQQIGYGEPIDFKIIGELPDLKKLKSMFEVADLLTKKGL